MTRRHGAQDPGSLILFLRPQVLVQPKLFSEVGSDSLEPFLVRGGGRFFEKKKTPGTAAAPRRCSVQFLEGELKSRGKDTHEGQLPENTRKLKKPKIKYTSVSLC